MAFDEADLEYLTGMGSIGADEQLLKQQLAQAENLRRTSSSVAGRSRGANIGRAAYAAAGALSDYKASQQPAAIEGKQQALLATLLRNAQRRAAMKAGGYAVTEGSTYLNDPKFKKPELLGVPGQEGDYITE